MQHQARSPPRQNPESWKRIRRTCVTLTFNGICLAVCGQPLAPSGASAFLPRTFRSPRKSKTLFQPHCLTPSHPAGSLHHHSLGGNASALGPQFSLLANGDAYPGKDGKVNHKRGAPPPVLPRAGGEGSWLQSFLPLELPPGTVWNFSFWSLSA